MDQGNPTGGSKQLADLIDKYGEFLIPDLKREYGIDLGDLFSDDAPLSPSWALMHAKALPIGSAFFAEVRGGQQFRGWDEDRYMTARLIDSIRGLTYLFICANTDPKKKKPTPPDPHPTPDGLRVKKSSSDKPGSFGSVSKSLLAKAKKRKGGV